MIAVPKEPLVLFDVLDMFQFYKSIEKLQCIKINRDKVF